MQQLGTPAPIGRRRALFGAAAVTGWILLWLVTKRWGERLLLTYVMQLPAPPLTAFWERRLNSSFILMASAAALGAWLLPIVAVRLRWHVALGVAFVSTFVFSCVFAINDGWFGFTDPVVERVAYRNAIDKVQSPGQFLNDFIDLVSKRDVGIHVQGHPPGMVLVTWALDKIGLGNGRVLTFIVVLGGAAAVVGVLVALRCLIDERIARQALPFVALSPACLWIASAPDAFFAGVVAWTIACVSFAVTSTSRRSLMWSGIAGVLYFCCLMLSYGYALVALPILVICIWKRRWQPLLVVAATSSALILLLLTQGFWWFEGLATTKFIYYDTVASQRPYKYFLFANIAALSISFGPMTLVAFTWLRDRGLWVVVASFVAVVGIANLSGLSKAEVERIWLPFTLFLLAGGAAFWTGRRPLRTVQIALAIQLSFAVWMQTYLRTFW